jgi:multiple sugar transport system substrate-binding protein
MGKNPCHYLPDVVILSHDGGRIMPNSNRQKIRTARISRREFIRLAGISAAGIALQACGSMGIAPTPTAEELVQLVYQDWRTEWFPGMAQEMLGQFHQLNPFIRVFYVPDPVDVEESLIVDMKAGTAPDVFAACCSFYPIIAQEGQTLDLRPFVAADLDEATIADWDQAQYKSFFTQDGRQYGLPKYHGALALYYNKDLFDEYQVDYPDGTWDYDDYSSAMWSLADDRDGDGEIDLWGSMLDVSWERLQVHVNAWGGHFVDPQNPTICRMGEPEALAAMEWIRARMWDDRVMASFLDVNNIGTRQAFVDQRVAMIEDGSWALKDILKDARFRVGVAPFPIGPARRVTLATTDGYGIYVGTKHPQAAWDLLKFLISKDYGRAMARANFLQPARASLLKDWENYIRAEFPEQTKDLDITAFADGHLKGYSVTAEIFPNMAEAKRLAYDAWDQIFTLGQAPVDILKDVSQSIQKSQQKAD